jgi:hypothetical protein
MAGSGASNLGYGNMQPYSNSPFINGTSTNNPANFSSNEVPGLPGLAGAKSNVDAAAGVVPGICLFKGGANFNGGTRGLKRKIKNITKRYKKMKGGSRKMKSLRKKLRSRMASRSLARSLAGGRRSRKNRKTRSRRQRGGYSQYQNNQPFSLNYSTGGHLSPSLSALASPVPIDKITNNAIDNYSRFENVGFPSKGH